MQSTTEFYNIKFKKAERINISEYENIKRDDKHYIGWLKIFFQELPKDFFIKLTQAKNYVLNIYKEKNKERGKIIAIVLPIGVVNSNILNDDIDDLELGLLKEREFVKKSHLPYKKAAYIWSKTKKG
jgi:hypothetical protein